jgi:hypothetical protein
MITDTTFFTNEPGYALLDRFKKTLKRKKTVKYKLPIDEEQGYLFAKSSLKYGRRSA